MKKNRENHIALNSWGHLENKTYKHFYVKKIQNREQIDIQMSFQGCNLEPTLSLSVLRSIVL